MEAHSGGPGQGSEFIVRLPLARRQAPAPEVKRTAATEPSDRCQQRVLVVDDNRDAADSLGHAAQVPGSRHRTWSTTARRRWKLPRPTGRRSVFLDIGMPGMDGYEVARRVRRQPEFQDVMLIALTGWGQEEDRRRSQEAGFDHHLVKPVDAGALQALLAALPVRPESVPGESGADESGPAAGGIGRLL